MLRSSQYWVLQLSVAPSRRTLTTAAASSYGSDKSPPPPPPSSSPHSSSSSSSHHHHHHLHSGSAHHHGPRVAAAAATAATAAAAAASATASTTLRVFSITSEPNVARHRGRSAMPAQSRNADDPSGSQAASDAARKSSRAAGLSSYFPLGYKEAAHQWWCGITPAAAERGVLAYVPYIREARPKSLSDTAATQPSALADSASASASASDPYGPRVWRSQMVPLSGKDRALNEYSVERVGEETTDTLVMLHGYGAGLGFFYRNFEPLSRLRGWQLYALDMLGMGNSSRPPFKVKAKDQPSQIKEAEAWFIDSLEEWRKIRKIERFTLMGHSMGGYLAVSYALKYPGRINKLILASPVGVPEDPYAVNAAMPDPEDSTLASEFMQDQDSVVNSQAAGEAHGDSTTTTTKVAPNYNYRHNHNHAVKKSTTKPVRRPLPGWFAYLWEANVSPFSLVRMSGPLGPRIVSGWTSRRFSHLDQEEADALHTYTYNLFRQRGSGEYALPYLLAPGAYARSPVINRIQNVGRQVIRPAQPATDTEPAKPEVRETGIPIVMMYGDHDWMDVAGGYAAEEKIKARVEEALLHGTPEEQKHENGSAKVLIVRNAGHHLYLDNPEEFNRYVEKELVDAQESERRLRRQQQQSKS